jgi:hypothetical protein
MILTVGGKRDSSEIVWKGIRLKKEIEVVVFPVLGKKLARQ